MNLITCNIESFVLATVTTIYWYMKKFQCQQYRNPVGQVLYNCCTGEQFTLVNHYFG